MSEQLNNFLDSGLLEEYVLGLTTVEEAREVEYYIESYPEIRKTYCQMKRGMSKFCEKEKKAYFSGQCPVSKSIVNNRFSSPWLIAGLLFAGLVTWQIVYHYVDSEEINKDKPAQTLLSSAETQAGQGHLRAQKVNQNLGSQSKYVLRGNSKAPLLESIVIWDRDTKRCHLRAIHLPKLTGKKFLQAWLKMEDRIISLGKLQSGSLELSSGILNDQPQALLISIEDGASKIPDLDKLVATLSL